MIPQSFPWRHSYTAQKWASSDSLVTRRVGGVGCSGMTPQVGLSHSIHKPGLGFWISWPVLHVGHVALLLLMVAAPVR